MAARRPARASGVDLGGGVGVVLVTLEGGEDAGGAVVNDDAIDGRVRLLDAGIGGRPVGCRSKCAMCADDVGSLAPGGQCVGNHANPTSSGDLLENRCPHGKPLACGDSVTRYQMVEAGSGETRAISMESEATELSAHERRFVTMILRESVSADNRVQRAALALADRGYSVRLLVAEDGRPTPGRLVDAGIEVFKIQGIPSIRPDRVWRRLLARLAHRTSSLPWPPRASDADRQPTPLAQANSEPGLFLTTLDRTVRAIRYMVCVRRLPGVVHAHNLNSLFVGVLGSFGRTQSIVYDAHEFEAARAGVSRRRLRARSFLERLLVKRVDAVITVSPSIVAALQERYSLAQVDLVRNTPDGSLDAFDGQNTPTFRLTPDERIVLYIGGVTPRLRGLEQLADAVTGLENAVLVLVGPDPRRFGAELEARHNTERTVVRTFPPVEGRLLPGLAAQADVGVCTPMNVSLNNYWCLPNKLFDYIAARTPVVASDFPDLREIVVGEGFGVVCDPSDPESLRAALRSLLDSPERLDQCRAAMEAGAHRHIWDVDRARLLGAYARLSSATSVEGAGPAG